MSTSTKRTVLQSVVVKKDGRSFVPPIGQVYEFTSEELADIERLNPDALSDRADVSVDDLAAAGGKKVKAADKDEGPL